MFSLEFENSVPEREMLKVLNDPRGPLIPEYNKIGRRIVAAARAQVGKKTGGLALSIHYAIGRWRAMPELWIGTYSPIARIHHEGTRPHAISARNGQMLRYSSRGRIVYARTVIHPGTKPNHYLTDNIYLARL